MEVAVRDEHEDDLASTVDTRDDMETDDYPKTSDDLEEDQSNDLEEDRDRADDGDDESIVGK
jgi:hypothetical protein